MLAYMRLLVREAKKYGGTGWITYDQVFRRNRPGPEARWDVLYPSLHIGYTSSQADSPATPCAICSEIDHLTEDCAPSSLAQATKKPHFLQLQPPGTSSEEGLRGQSGSSQQKPSRASTFAYRGTGAGVLFQEPAISSTSASRAEASTHHKNALRTPISAGHCRSVGLRHMACRQGQPHQLP
jgi:hypothetical protein